MPDYNRSAMETHLENGKPAPDFQLQDLHGETHTLRQVRGRLVLLNFWSAECPWSERVDRLLFPNLLRWGDRVVLLLIGANANEPADLLERVSAERGLPPILLDPAQSVVDRYGAQTTPHFFILDDQGLLRYQGAYDDVTFRQRSPTRSYVVEAMEALLKGVNPEIGKKPAYGCTIVRVQS